MNISLKEEIQSEIANKRQRLDELNNTEQLNKSQVSEQTKIETQLDKLLKKYDDIENNEQYREDMLRTIRAFLNNNDYYWVTDLGCWMRRDGASWATVRDSALKIELPELKQADFYKLFDEELTKQHRKFQKFTATYKEVEPKTLNRLTTDNWLQPDLDAINEFYENDKLPQPHWLFTTLLRSLGGDKRENIDHIEKVIAAKYTQPDNFLLPCMIIFGKSGGVGKNLFIERVLRTIFTFEQVSCVESRDVTGQFNQFIEGKSVVYIDEAVDHKVDEERLKSILGSSTIKIEPKYVNAYTVDNTPLYIIGGNPIKGSVKLAGEETDRRYSVIEADRPLKQFLANEIGCSETEAWEWTWKEGQKILEDPKEVSLWLAYILCKWGAPNTVMPLHGEDYRNMLGVQRPVWQDLVDSVFIDDQYTYIKLKTLYDVYKHWSHSQNPRGAIMAKNTFSREVERWLDKAELGFEKCSVRWKDGNNTTSAIVLKHKQQPKSLTSNDADFIKYDDFGREMCIYEY